MIGIKVVSALFDFLLGYFVYRIVALRYPGRWWPVLAGTITLFLPTVVVNASMWGQADAMYAAFAVGGVQVVARRGRDEDALAAAARLEGGTSL